MSEYVRVIEEEEEEEGMEEGEMDMCGKKHRGGM